MPRIQPLPLKVHRPEILRLCAACGGDQAQPALPPGSTRLIKGQLSW